MRPHHLSSARCRPEKLDAYLLFATTEIHKYLIIQVPVNGEHGNCQNLFHGIMFVYKLIIIIEWGANRGH